MKSLRYFLPILLPFLLSVSSCQLNDQSTGLLTLVNERDSLRKENDRQRERLDLINSMMSTINSALDSISTQENLLFVNPNSEIPASKSDVIKNLARYERVLHNQRSRIEQLKQELGMNKNNTGMTGMVEVLQQQLAAKDRQMAQLKSELAKKDVDISRLRKEIAAQRSQIEEQSNTIVQLDKTAKSQGEALVKQDEIINSGYVIVGRKKDLERKSIIKKKRLIPESAFDKTKFARVDIRKYREITFSAKKPKILTDMPQQSYSLTTDGKGNFTLHITSPADFWRISNYLVIQTD